MPALAFIILRLWTLQTFSCQLTRWVFVNLVMRIRVAARFLATLRITMNNYPISGKYYGIQALIVKASWFLDVVAIHLEIPLVVTHLNLSHDRIRFSSSSVWCRQSSRLIQIVSWALHNSIFIHHSHPTISHQSGQPLPHLTFINLLFHLYQHDWT